MQHVVLAEANTHLRCAYRADPAAAAETERRGNSQKHYLRLDFGVDGDGLDRGLGASAQLDRGRSTRGAQKGGRCPGLRTRPALDADEQYSRRHLLQRYGRAERKHPTLA